VQRFALSRCHTLDVITTESIVTEPQPIAAPAEGESATYDRLFGTAHGRLVRICAGFVGADAAQDVVHDAYLRGRHRFHQLRDVDLFEAWLTRIAINLCVNRHRSARRLLGLLPILARREPDASDVGLRDLVERLPPRERTLVVLHYGYGYRFDEIARLTGLTAVNARTIVFRARRRLAGQVQDWDR
jgi:RNA polymerase sigma-70 factor, ECF subfamily